MRTVLVDEIDERAADALDGGNIQRLVVAGVGLGAELYGVIEGVAGMHDAPGHRRRARPVLGDEARGERAGLGIQDVVDVALAIDGDVLGLVARDRDVAHALEQIRQLRRLGMGELDELEAVGAGGVGGGNGGGRGVVREGTH